METEFPDLDRDYPEVVNMHETEAASVQAELVRASASQIKQLTAQEVDLRDSVAVVVNAETVNARKTGVAHLEAGNFTLLDGTVLVSKSNSATLKGRAGVVIADTAGIENGSVVVLASRSVKADNIRTGILDISPSLAESCVQDKEGGKGEPPPFAPAQPPLPPRARQAHPSGDAQQLFYGGHDPRRLNRLGDVGIGAEPERALAILSPALGRDHHDRRIPMGRVHPHALNQLEAIHDRHVDVRQDDVELASRQLSEAVHAIIRFRHAEVGDAPERKHHQLAHHGRIFDNEAGVFGHGTATAQPGLDGGSR